MSDSEREAANGAANEDVPDESVPADEPVPDEPPVEDATAEDGARRAERGGEEAAGESVEDTAAAASPLVGDELPIGGPADRVPEDRVPEDRVVELEAEVAGLKDELLRALAETENVRRRGQRERDDLRKYAAGPVVKDLLSVADNLARALDSVAAEGLSDDGPLKSLVEGVQMTQRELAQAFERHAIHEIEALGRKLDPHVHEAMFEVPDPNRPNGTVVQVVQPGYMLHDRLLRPARVGVAKGGPAAAPSGGDQPEPGSHVDTEA